MNLQELKKEIPYKWKIQTLPKNGKKGACVAYIDARDVQDLLDEVCGVENWQNEFYEVKGKVFCRIGVYASDRWIWKSDSGALEKSEHIDEDTANKGETSDAFKRAAVQWGIGRFLYSKDIVYMTEEEYQDNKYRITDFCNGNKKTSQTKTWTIDQWVTVNKSLTCTKCGVVQEATVFSGKFGPCFKCSACGKYSAANKLSQMHAKPEEAYE